MTYSEKKDYLNRYANLIHKISGLSSEYHRLQDLGERINQQYSAAPGGSGKEGKVEKAGMGMADITAQISQEIQAATTARDEIINTIITKTARYRHADILTMRYIHMMPIAKIAETYGKDTRTIGRALKEAITGLKI